MKNRSDIILAIVVIGSVFLFMGFMAVAMIGMMSDDGNDTSSMAGITTGNRIGLIEIVGPIYDSRRWCKEIDEFRHASHVKAIVIRIDSPGGGVAASQELYQAILRARDAKPVVISMGGVAASGGYYAAIAGDTIVANPGTTTGSIGVLIELTRVKELMDKIGVQSESITSGEFKDAGSPFKDMSKRDREYFQGYIDDAYEQFITAVSQQRGISLKDVRKVADGRVFTGRQAKEFGLVDVMGDMYEAIRIAGNMCDLGDEPKTCKPVKKRKSFDWVDYVLDDLGEEMTRRFDSKPAFQYRWHPGGGE